MNLSKQTLERNEGNKTPPNNTLILALNKKNTVELYVLGVIKISQ